MAEKTSKFIGATVTLGANTSDTIRLRTERPAKIVAIGFSNTGRCNITKLEQVEIEVYLSGVIEVDNLVTNGMVYKLAEPWNWQKGVDLVIALTDISGASNVVTVLFETIPA